MRCSGIIAVLGRDVVKARVACPPRVEEVKEEGSKGGSMNRIHPCKLLAQALALGTVVVVFWNQGALCRSTIVGSLCCWWHGGSSLGLARQSQLVTAVLYHSQILVQNLPVIVSRNASLRFCVASHDE